MEPFRTAKIVLDLAVLKVDFGYEKHNCDLGKVLDNGTMGQRSNESKIKNLTSHNYVDLHLIN